MDFDQACLEGIIACCQNIQSGRHVPCTCLARVHLFEQLLPHIPYRPFHSEGSRRRVWISLSSPFVPSIKACFRLRLFAICGKTSSEGNRLSYLTNGYSSYTPLFPAYAFAVSKTNQAYRQQFVVIEPYSGSCIICQKSGRLDDIRTSMSQT